MSDATLVRVETSGPEGELVRINIPGRRMDDITRDEARAAYCALGAYLIRTAAGPPVRMGNSGG
ncbi:hypothetical protein [Embleya sp. AB8]|uniref:hypothetical protein n=1 Tax=Embleya sp. AB8 TaxID=3156304 RepID=UPI003C78A05B